MSRKSELGFETGFTTSFLRLFASHLFKINSILFLIALVFYSIIIFLRCRSESSSISPNGLPAHEDSPLIEDVILGVDEYGSDQEIQVPSRMEDSSGQSLLPNQRIDQEESYGAMHDSARMGEVSEGSTLLLDGDNEQEEEPSSLQAESLEKDQVSSAWVRGSPRQAPRLRRRTPGTHISIAKSLFVNRS